MNRYRHEYKYLIDPRQEAFLRIRAAGVAHPAQARYAWTDWSDRVNLFGVNGLPVEPFWV